MRPFQLFAVMPPEQFRAFHEALKKQAPMAYAQSLGLTAGALKARPVFLQRQPPERRAELVRKALARVKSSPIAEEMLAVYFLECRTDLLVEWLDLLGLEHEKGTLKGEDAPPEPSAEKLDEALTKYRNNAKDEDRADRELLLQAFAAQTSIDWPEFEKLLAA